MALRRFVFLLLVVVLVVDHCYGQKKGKKNKGKSGKNKNKNKNKQKVDVATPVNNAGSPLVKFENKAPYRTERDEDYWTAGGTQRSHILEDYPHNNPEFLQLYDEIRNAVLPPGTTPADLTNRDFVMTSEQLADQYFAHLAMVQDLHVIMHYKITQGIVHTVFATHLYTKNGTDIPPIMSENPWCLPEYCMHPDYFVPYFSESDYFLPIPESPIHRFTEEMLEKLELMLDMYPIETVRNIVCQPVQTSSDASWLNKELEMMRLQVEEFLDEPAASTVLQVENDLEMVHDFVRGNLISVLLRNLCSPKA